MNGVVAFAERFESLALPARKVALALYVSLTASLLAAAVGPVDVLPASVVLAFGLSWASMVDIDRFILPDVLTLGLVLAGLAFALVRGLPEALPFVIGAAAGYACLAAVAATYQRLRGRSGLGLGDAKLLAVGGAWLGWMALPTVLLVASIGCLAVVLARAMIQRRRISDGPIPFGPYLAGAIWMLWLFGAGERI